MRAASGRLDTRETVHWARWERSWIDERLALIANPLVSNPPSCDSGVLLALTDRRLIVDAQVESGRLFHTIPIDALTCVVRASDVCELGMGHPDWPVASVVPLCFEPYASLMRPIVRGLDAPYALTDVVTALQTADRGERASDVDPEIRGPHIWRAETLARQLDERQTTNVRRRAIPLVNYVTRRHLVASVGGRERRYRLSDVACLTTIVDRTGSGVVAAVVGAGVEMAVVLLPTSEQTAETVTRLLAYRSADRQVRKRAPRQ